MSVVANIAINVDSTKAVSQLQAVDRAAAGVSGNTGKLQQAFGGLNTALAGLGLGVLIKDLTGVGIDADRTGKRIQSLAGASGETGKVLAIASKAAKDFGLSNLEAQKGVADLYGRLRPAGVALKDIETVYNGVNKAALAAGLSNADTSGVFLQLSQALGSGALQGDELRSIMEQMPAVGQAVAKVMGVTVGEVKKLGSDGKITTDIMIKAAAELNKLAPPPPDPFKVFNAEMENLRVELGENILPILTPFVQLLLGAVKAFSAMPEPLQTAIVALGLIATAILAIGAAVAFLAPVIAGFKTFALAIGGLKIGATIAGWAAAAGPAIIAIKAAFAGFMAFLTGTLLPGLVAIFSGPVGWTVLAVAAVVAMVVLFREPIMQFFTWLGGAISTAFSGLMAALQPIFVQPFIDLWNNVLRGPITAALGWIKNEFEYAMRNLGTVAYDLFVKPWVDLWENVLRNPVTAAISWLENAWSNIATFFDNKVIKPIQQNWDRMLDFLAKAADKISTNINNAWKSIVTFFTNNVTKPITTAWNAFTTLLPKAASGASTKISDAWKNITKFFSDNVTKPINTAWTNLINFLPKAANTMGEAVKRVFVNVGSAIKGVLNGVLRGVFGAVNGAIGNINKLVAAANGISAKVNGPQIPYLPTLSVPQFAEGGVVNKPTLAMVGEGGEREYIIPESKMAATAANYLNGVRGGSAIPSGNAQINVTTGPVLQHGGQQYVTMADLEKAMRKTADGVYASLRTPASRIAMGRA
jgi:tape measure domain-containing protein